MMATLYSLFLVLIFSGLVYALEQLYLQRLNLRVVRPKDMRYVVRSFVSSLRAHILQPVHFGKITVSCLGLATLIYAFKIQFFENPNQLSVLWFLIAAVAMISSLPIFFGKRNAEFGYRTFNFTKVFWLNLLSFVFVSGLHLKKMGPVFDTALMLVLFSLLIYFVYELKLYFSEHPIQNESSFVVISTSLVLASTYFYRLLLPWVELQVELLLLFVSVIVSTTYMIFHTASRPGDELRKNRSLSVLCILLATMITVVGLGVSL